MSILQLKLLGTLAVLACIFGIVASTASALEYESTAGKYTDSEATFLISVGKTGAKLAQIKCAEATFTVPTKKGSL
jgi:predicted outer membrane lipoprotein